MSTAVAAPSTTKLAKYVCIANIGHTGSTLFGMLLDQYPEMTSMAEITHLHEFVTHPEKPCSCGVPVLECPFWNAVEEELRRRRGDRNMTLASFAWQPEPKTTAFRKLPALAELLMIWGSPGLWDLGARFNARTRREREFGLRAIALFEAIAAVRGTPLVASSTGATTQFKSIYLADPRRFQAIHIVRDGRGWTCSLMRREKVGMEYAARLWSRRHWNSDLMLRSIPRERWMRLRYEDLCLRTAETMAEVSRFLDVPTQLTDFTLKKTEFHGLGGNPMRFRYDESTIQLDEKWRNDLSPADLAIFERIGGKRNRELGYT